MSGQKTNDVESTVCERSPLALARGSRAVGAFISHSIAQIDR